jgi:molecular chaperone GrpE
MGNTPWHEESRKMSTLNETTVGGDAEEPKDVLDGDMAASRRQANPQGQDGDAESLQEEIGRLQDLWLRARAELDNARKRKAKEMSELRQRTREDIVRELLPIIDNLERAAESTQTSADIEAVTQGVTMVLRGFQDTADRIGLRRVESVGARFDPAKHEAWQHTETAEHQIGTVIAEFEPGYLLGTRLLRPAKVAVARPPTPEPSHDDDADPEAEDATAAPADEGDSRDEDVLFIEDEGEASEDTPDGEFEEDGNED